MRFASRIYRRLAEAFPHEFQIAYGAEITGLAEDVVEDVAKRYGTWGLIRLLADIAVRIPLEYLTEMRGDFRYAWRGLIHSPGFALVGIVSMGLGIGLATNVYTSKWSLLFRPLPGAANAERLVMLQKSTDADLAPVSYYYIEQFREQKNLFTGVAGFETGVPFNVTFEGNWNAKPLRVLGQLVSPDYFSVLGLKAQRGRVLNAADDRFGEAPAVVISDHFWRNRLNSSPQAVGQALRLNGQLATIVGITPKDFNGAVGIMPAELFVPITVPASLAPELAGDILHRHDMREFLALFCLAPRVTVDSAEAGLEAITRRLDQQETWAPARIDTGKSIALLAAGSNVPMPRKLKPALIGFFVALMGLVTTLACLNLANMLMARSANRRKEFAIRVSVGAGRARLVRQLMSEGILLSLLGGLAGFMVACALAALNRHFVAPDLPLEMHVRLDWRAGFFALAVAVLCGVGFTLVPALRAGRHDLTLALKQGWALQLPGYRRFGFRNLLMVIQVGASLMLLLVTGFLVLGINKSTGVQTKFDPRAMTVFSLDPVRDGYPAEKTQALFEQIARRLDALPSVQRTAFSAAPPFSTDLEPTAVSTESTPGASRVQFSAYERTVGAGFFAALDEPILAGREFTKADERGQVTTSTALPLVLSESAVRGLFGSDSALGKRVRDENRSYEVVGVVGDTKNLEGLSQTTVYLPLTSREFSRPPAGGIIVLLRCNPGADPLGAVRDEIAFLDSHLNLFNAQTLQTYLDRSRAATRFSVQTYGGMGVFGLLLAAIGLAGVTAYAVAQRRKEIGIRTALGASKAHVLALVLREGTALIVIGIAMGLVGAIGLAKIVSALIETFADALRIGANDRLLLVGAPLLLAIVAMLACYLPARRAAKIDPLRALREE
jgi:macrolide transport system ATP-binding/permease protein